LYKDYLETTAEDFDNKKINAVFLSPPWGGVGYGQMEKYKFDYMHPHINDILSKSLEFSRNLILYIPRNTDVQEICTVLSAYSDKISTPGEENELVFEIERLGHHQSATSVLAVYTGELAQIPRAEIYQHMCEKYFDLPPETDSALENVEDM
jgi:hypothetical protein